MTKNIRTLLAFSIIAVAGSALPACAAEINPIHVNVPFAFKAGKNTLPAGEYTVSEEESGVITIKGNKGGVMVLGSVAGDSTSDKASISFGKDEKGYYLKSVQGWGGISSNLLPISDAK